MINILDEEDALASRELLWLAGSRGSWAVVADLEAIGLVVKVEDHHHSVGHCQRSEAVVEPRLSLQWFVSTKPLADRAMAAARSGETQIVPKRFEATWYHWMENIETGASADGCGGDTGSCVVR